MKLTEHAPLKPLVNTSAPIATPGEEEERKKVERDQEKSRRDLEDRMKDLEVEVTCARAREEEAKRLVEELVRSQAQAG